MFKQFQLMTTAFCACVFLMPITAQNLISHGNFETTTQLVRYQQMSGNGNFDPLTFATGWHSPTGGSPDLFDDGTLNQFVCGSVYDNAANPLHKCCYPQVCATRNIFGSQEPRDHTGDPDWMGEQFNDRYVGIAPGKEYIQQGPFAPLTAGVTYQLSFWVSCGDLSPNAVRMQALLSNLPLTDLNNTSYMNFSSDPSAYVVTATEFVYDRELWTKLVFNFTASGSERYITLGVFSNSIYNPVSQSNEFLSATNNAPGDCVFGSVPNGCGGEVPYPSLTWMVGNQTFTGCSNTEQNLLCQAAGIDYLYIDDVFLRAICQGFNNPTDYVNATLSNSNSAVNSNILLTGNITISGTVSFAGCTVRCNPGTFISIPSGSTLQLSNGTVISGGCNNLMWYGIRVNPGGTLKINAATIEDAIQAIECNAGFLSIDKATFNKNVDFIVP